MNNLRSLLEQLDDQRYRDVATLKNALEQLFNAKEAVLLYFGQNREQLDDESIRKLRRLRQEIEGLEDKVKDLMDEIGE